MTMLEGEYCMVAINKKLRISKYDLSSFYGNFVKVIDSTNNHRFTAGILRGSNLDTGFAYIENPVNKFLWKAKLVNVKISDKSDYSLLNIDLKNSFVKLINDKWRKLSLGYFSGDIEKIQLYTRKGRKVDIEIYQSFGKESYRYLCSIVYNGLFISKSRNLDKYNDLSFLGNNDLLYESFTQKEMGIINSVIKFFNNNKISIRSISPLKCFTYIIVEGCPAYQCNVNLQEGAWNCYFGIDTWYDIDMNNEDEVHLNLKKSGLMKSEEKTVNCLDYIEEDDKTKLIWGIEQLKIIKVNTWYPVIGIDLMFVGKFSIPNLEVIYISKSKLKSGEFLNYSVNYGKIVKNKITGKKVLDACFTLNGAIECIQNRIRRKWQSSLEVYNYGSRGLEFEDKFFVYSIEDDLSMLSVSYSLKIHSMYSLRYTLRFSKSTKKLEPGIRPISVKEVDLYKLIYEIGKKFNKYNLLEVKNHSYSIYSYRWGKVVLDEDRLVDVAYSLDDCKRIVKNRKGTHFLVVEFSEKSIVNQFDLKKNGDIIDLVKLERNKMV